MGKPLPVLISIPHGGLGVPDELRLKTPLQARDIFEDGDPLTREIYDFKGRVKVVIAADMGRAFVDLNRTVTDLPPENPDGIVKLHTLTGKPVYHHGDFPDEALRQQLLDRYYHPYHQAIARALANQGFTLALDCHSMLPSPPYFSKTLPQKRPMICLSNGGDKQGEAEGKRPLFCPPDWLRRFAECLSDSFCNETGEITLNEPFRGGHISVLHSNKVPWIQVELNRDLYLSKPWYDEKTLTVSKERIRKLNEMMFEALKNLIIQI